MKEHDVVILRGTIVAVHEGIKKTAYTVEIKGGHGEVVLVDAEHVKPVIERP